MIRGGKSFCWVFLFFRLGKVPAIFGSGKWCLSLLDGDKVITTKLQTPRSPNWIDLSEKLCDYCEKVDALFQWSKAGWKRNCVTKLPEGSGTSTHKTYSSESLCHILFKFFPPLQTHNSVGARANSSSCDIRGLVPNPTSRWNTRRWDVVSHFGVVRVSGQITRLMIVIERSSRDSSKDAQSTAKRVRNLVCYTRQSMAPTSLLSQIRLFAFQRWYRPAIVNP